MTYFEHYSESPEVLAEMIYNVIKDSEVCNCPALTYCNGSGIHQDCISALTTFLKTNME
jgi:hypothetical protein